MSSPPWNRSNGQARPQKASSIAVSRLTQQEKCRVSRPHPLPPEESATSPLPSRLHIQPDVTISDEGRSLIEFKRDCHLDAYRQRSSAPAVFLQGHQYPPCWQSTRIGTWLHSQAIISALFRRLLVSCLPSTMESHGRGRSRPTCRSSVDTSQPATSSHYCSGFGRAELAPTSSSRRTV